MKFYLQKQWINFGIGVMLLFLLVGFAPSALVIPGQERSQQISIPDRQSQPYAIISPANGPPGTAVQLTAGGFPANTRINIRIGWANPGAYYRVVDVGFTSAEGTFGGRVTIPVFARPGQTWVVVVTAPQQPHLTTVSNVFEVTGVAGQGQVPIQSP